MLIWTLFFIWTWSSNHIGSIEGRENLNHEGYVEDENYHNVDSDDSDGDDN